MRKRWMVLRYLREPPKNGTVELLVIAMAPLNLMSDKIRYMR